jgi:hypothetical protein
MKHLILSLLLIGFAFGENVQELIEKAKEKNPELQAIQNKLKSYQAKQDFEGSLDDQLFKLFF